MIELGRRGNPGRAQEVDREDRAARALRPPGRPGPRPTADLQGNPTPLTSLYNTALARAVAGQGEGLSGVLPLRPQREEAGLKGDELQARRWAIADATRAPRPPATSRSGSATTAPRKSRKKSTGKLAPWRKAEAPERCRRDSKMMVRAGQPRARHVRLGATGSARMSARRRRPTTTSSGTTRRTRRCRSRKWAVRPQPQGHPPGLQLAGLATASRS